MYKLYREYNINLTEQRTARTLKFEKYTHPVLGVNRLTAVPAPSSTAFNRALFAGFQNDKIQSQWKSPLVSFGQRFFVTALLKEGKKQ